MSMFLLLLKSMPALVPFIAEIIKQKGAGTVSDRRAKNPLVPWLVITSFLLLSTLAYGLSFVSEHSAIERKLTLENAKVTQDYDGAKALEADLRKEISFLRTKALEYDEELKKERTKNNELNETLLAKAQKIEEISKNLDALKEEFEKANREVKESRKERSELEKRLEAYLKRTPAKQVKSQPTVSKAALAALESLASN